MQLFWYPPLDEVWRFDYNSTDMPEEYVPEIIPAAAQEPTVPAAGPSPPAGPVVSAQAVGGRRHLMQGVQLMPLSLRCNSRMAMQACLAIGAVITYCACMQPQLLCWRPACSPRRPPQSSAPAPCTSPPQRSEHYVLPSQACLSLAFTTAACSYLMQAPRKGWTLARRQQFHLACLRVLANNEYARKGMHNCTCWRL